MVKAAAVERIKEGMQYEFDRTAPPEGFPQLPPIPGGRYTDPDFLALEQRHLWNASWLYACHIDEIPEPGHFLLFKRTGSPILILHGTFDALVPYAHLERARALMALARYGEAADAAGQILEHWPNHVLADKEKELLQV